MGIVTVADGWLVRPSDDGAQDLLVLEGVTVGSILWLRPLRLPALSRGRMTDGLNGVVSAHGARHVWSARRYGADDTVWLIFHNGVEVGELRWFHSVGRSPHGVLAGLNMQVGRRPVACEPMPLERPHLRLVR